VKRLLVFALVLMAGKASAQAAQPARPSVDPALADFQQGTTITGVVRSVGSSTLSNLLFRWSAEFRRLYPEVEMHVIGGGSETALPALIEGRADLGPMSRPMRDAESERFRQKFGYAPTRLTVAVDAIAVYVNKYNPLRQISLRELEAIFSDRPKSGGAPIRTWGQLGLKGEWAARKIIVKGPSPTQGMYGVFRSTVLKGGNYRIDMRPEPVASSIVQGIATEEGAIGFASQFLEAARTRALAIAREDGGPYVPPTGEHAIDGSYPLARKLFIYLNRAPGTTLSPAVSEFLRFICSEHAQQIAAQGGNIPLNATLAARECALGD
jgi:phosphate transport system substrate-binding protein